MDEGPAGVGRIAVLDSGVIVAEGTAAEIKRRVGQELVELTLVDGSVEWLRGDGTAGMFAFVALFVPYLSSAFVPVEGLPPFLREFAEHQPFSLAVGALRELTSGPPSAARPRRWPSGWAGPWP